MTRDEDLEASIVAKFAAMSPLLDERARRLGAAAESIAVGYGGDALVSSATGLARETIRNVAASRPRVPQRPDGFAVPGPGGQAWRSTNPA